MFLCVSLILHYINVFSYLIIIIIINKMLTEYLKYNRVLQIIDIVYVHYSIVNM